jgi:anti-sigma factor RsiW
MSDIHALSGAYVLDAVNDLERAEFERHLASCAHCHDEVRGLRETAAHLPHVSSAPPPLNLRAKILADVQGVRPLPPAVPTVRRRKLLPAFAAAAAVIVAVGTGLTAIAWHPWQPDTVQVSLADQVRTATDAQTWTTQMPDGARMTVVRSRSVGAAVWTSSGVGPAPSGHVYELWLQRKDESLVPAGLMSSGDGQLVLKGDATAAIGAGLTVEPAGGSLAPTTKPLAFFDFRVAS